MSKIYGNSKIGKDTYIGDNVIIGYPGKAEKQLLLNRDFDKLGGSIIGDNCVIRDYGLIYSNAEIGNNVNTGHHFLVREQTKIGDFTLIGSNVIIEDKCKIGNNVSIQSGVYIPTNCIIEKQVFIGPNAVLTNDKFMQRGEIKLKGVIIKKGARIGANSTILPGIKIGMDSLIGAGAVVTKDVKSYEIVTGIPAKKIGEVPKADRISW